MLYLNIFYAGFQIKPSYIFTKAQALKEKNNYLQAKPPEEITELQPPEERSVPVN